MYKLMKNYPFINYQLCIKRHYQRSYYETLGLTPKATQSDIKSAYYNLSMKFHPDKFKGEGTKFQEINSAYEVLGNVKLRRMYDRGLINHGQTPPNPDDIPPDPPQQEKPRADSRYYRAQQMPTSGRTRVYDFDEWQRAHYDKVRARDDKRKQREMQFQANRVHMREQSGTDVFMWFVSFITFTYICIAFFPGNKSYDQPSKPKKASNNNNNNNSKNNNTNTDDNR